MLSINYNLLQFSQVMDKSEFFKTSKLPEITKIRAMIDTIKILFHLPANAIDIMVSEGDRVYKLIVHTSNINRNIIGWFVYIPLQNRVDLYDAINVGDIPIPLVQWKNKKVVFKSYSPLLELVGVNKLFEKVINVS